MPSTTNSFLIKLIFIALIALPTWANASLNLSQTANTYPYSECFNLACQYLNKSSTDLPLDPQYKITPTIQELEARPRSEKYSGLGRDTGNLAILSLGIMGILYAMPESVSKWDKDEMKLKDLGSKWKRNIKDGPIWDQDEWQINYLGHPYFGAAYYVMARNQGLSPLESGGYSFLMSTFLWEMGVESFAEIPSKQDLIITPLIGSVIGEAFFIWEDRIRSNNYELFGSTILGRTATFLLNPAGSFSSGMSSLIDGKTKKDTYGFEGGWVWQTHSYRFIPGEGEYIETDLLGLEIKYNF